jgi:hypothetical protein
MQVAAAKQPYCIAQEYWKDGFLAEWFRQVGGASERSEANGRSASLADGPAGNTKSHHHRLKRCGFQA